MLISDSLQDAMISATGGFIMAASCKMLSFLHHFWRQQERILPALCQTSPTSDLTGFCRSQTWWLRTIFLLCSRKVLAEQTTPGSQGANSFQLHMGAAHLLAVGHGTGSLCEAADWKYSTAPRLLGGTAGSAHQICYEKSTLKPSFWLTSEFLHTSVISYPCSAADVRHATWGWKHLQEGQLSRLRESCSFFQLSRKSKINSTREINSALHKNSCKVNCHQIYCS